MPSAADAAGPIPRGEAAPGRSVSIVLIPTLAALRPEGVSRVRIRLDVSGQPFLEDHRVGERAIFSTVMSLEAMAEAALEVRPGSVIQSVSRVVKRQPLFVSDGEPQTIEVEVEVVADADDALRCRVVSDPDGARVDHDEALLHLAARLPGARAGVPPADGGAGSPVDQATIYQLYFHGPSFQVIRSAHLEHGDLVASLAADLPPLVDPPLPSAVAPRLIELCLQSAGLLELEATGRMMIPRSLDLVVRHSDRDSDSGLPFRAVVHRRRTLERSGVVSSPSLPTDLADDGEPLVFDAAVLDDSDRVHLEVRGYRTAPYDQLVDDAAIAAITSALRG